MKKGIFCLSFDTELLWGRHDSRPQIFEQRAQRVRPVIKELLSILNRYKVPATWAVVGHLFLDECKLVQGIKHPEIIRPKFPWVDGDWFRHDPMSTLKDKPGWYGKDLIQLLSQFKNQEIASHTFSHIYFGHEGCSKECAESELQNCVKLAEKNDLKLKSFVFPKNLVGHLDLLKKYGFTSYRGADRYYNLPQIIYQMISLVNLFFPLFSLTATPQKNQAITNIPGTMYFVSSRGKRRYLPKNSRSAAAKRGIDEAIHKKSVFHLWTHPIDFTEDTQHLLNEFEKIIHFAAQKRDEEFLEIKNMGQIAKSLA